MPILPFDAYVVDLIRHYGYAGFEEVKDSSSTIDNSAVRFYIMYLIWVRGIKKEFQLGKEMVLSLVDIVQHVRLPLRQKLKFLSDILVAPLTTKARTWSGLLPLSLLTALVLVVHRMRPTCNEWHPRAPPQTS